MYSCEQCNYKSNGKAAVKRHNKKHIHTESEQMERYQCSKCVYQSNKKQSIQQHIEAQHLGIRYSCDLCDYKTNIKQNLMKHLSTTEMPNKCDQCCFSSSNKRCLKIHKTKKHLAKHQGTKDSCYVCGKTTSRKYLETHIAQQYLGIRFGCDNCDYQASSKICLKLHVNQRHLGIRYGCNKCDHKAITKAGLKLHRTKTLGNKA